MTAVKWIVAVLFAWGLFTGIAFVLVPLATSGWGNTVSFFAGVGLILVCGAGLIRIEPGARQIALNRVPCSTRQSRSGR